MNAESYSNVKRTQENINKKKDKLKEIADYNEQRKTLKTRANSLHKMLKNFSEKSAGKSAGFKFDLKEDEFVRMLHDNDETSRWINQLPPLVKTVMQIEGLEPIKEYNPKVVRDDQSLERIDDLKASAYKFRATIGTLTSLDAESISKYKPNRSFEPTPTPKVGPVKETEQSLPEVKKWQPVLKLEEGKLSLENQPQPYVSKTPKTDSIKNHIFNETVKIKAMRENAFGMGAVAAFHTGARGFVELLYGDLAYKGIEGLTGFNSEEFFAPVNETILNNNSLVSDAEYADYQKNKDVYEYTRDIGSGVLTTSMIMAYIAATGGAGALQSIDSRAVSSLLGKFGLKAAKDVLSKGATAKAAGEILKLATKGEKVLNYADRVLDAGWKFAKMAKVGWLSDTASETYKDVEDDKNLFVSLAKNAFIEGVSRAQEGASEVMFVGSGLVKDETQGIIKRAVKATWDYAISDFTTEQVGQSVEDLVRGEASSLLALPFVYKHVDEFKTQLKEKGFSKDYIEREGNNLKENMRSDIYRAAISMAISGPMVGGPVQLSQSIAMKNLQKKYGSAAVEAAQTIVRQDREKLLQHFNESLAKHSQHDQISSKLEMLGGLNYLSTVEVSNKNNNLTEEQAKEEEEILANMAKHGELNKLDRTIARMQVLNEVVLPGENNTEVKSNDFKKFFMLNKNKETSYLGLETAQLKKATNAIMSEAKKASQVEVTDQDMDLLKQLFNPKDGLNPEGVIDLTSNESAAEGYSQILLEYALNDNNLKNKLILNTLNDAQAKAGRELTQEDVEYYTTGAETTINFLAQQKSEQMGKIGLAKVAEQIESIGLVDVNDFQENKRILELAKQKVEFQKRDSETQANFEDIFTTAAISKDDSMWIGGQDYANLRLSGHGAESILMERFAIAAKGTTVPMENGEKIVKRDEKLMKKLSSLLNNKGVTNAVIIEAIATNNTKPADKRMSPSQIIDYANLLDFRGVDLRKTGIFNQNQDLLNEVQPQDPKLTIRDTFKRDFVNKYKTQNAPAGTGETVTSPVVIESVEDSNESRQDEFDLEGRLTALNERLIELEDEVNNPTFEMAPKDIAQMTLKELDDVRKEVNNINLALEDKARQNRVEEREVTPEYTEEQIPDIIRPEAEFEASQAVEESIKPKKKRGRPRKETTVRKLEEAGMIKTEDPIGSDQLKRDAVEDIKATEVVVPEANTDDVTKIDERLYDENFDPFAELDNLFTDIKPVDPDNPKSSIEETQDSEVKIKGKTIIFPPGKLEVAKSIPLGTFFDNLKIPEHEIVDLNDPKNAEIKKKFDEEQARNGAPSQAIYWNEKVYIPTRWFEKGRTKSELQTLISHETIHHNFVELYKSNAKFRDFVKSMIAELSAKSASITDQEFDSEMQYYFNDPNEFIAGLFSHSVKFNELLYVADHRTFFQPLINFFTNSKLEKGYKETMLTFFKNAVPSAERVINEAKSSPEFNDSNIESYGNQIQVTKGQKLALQGFVKFLDDPEAQFMTLAGYAGTGKTTIMQKMLAYAEGNQRKQWPTMVIAPTWSAVKSAGKRGVPATTIASTLYKYDRFGNRDLNPNFDSGVFPQIVFVDETSMVSPIDLATMSQAISAGSKIVFVGDPLQLPSPQYLNEEQKALYAPFLNVLRNSNKHSYLLKDVVRTTNRLSDFFTAFRGIGENLINRGEKAIAKERVIIPESNEVFEHYADSTKIFDNYVTALTGGKKVGGVVSSNFERITANFNILYRLAGIKEQIPTAFSKAQQLTAAVKMSQDFYADPSRRASDYVSLVSIHNGSVHTNGQVTKEIKDGGQITEDVTEPKTVTFSELVDVEIEAADGYGRATYKAEKYIAGGKILLVIPSYLPGTFTKSNIRRINGKFLDSSQKAQLDGIYTIGEFRTAQKFQGDETDELYFYATYLNFNTGKNGQKETSEYLIRQLYTSFTRAKQKIHFYADKKNVVDNLIVAPWSAIDRIVDQMSKNDGNFAYLAEEMINGTKEIVSAKDAKLVINYLDMNEITSVVKNDTGFEATIMPNNGFEFLFRKNGNATTLSYRPLNNDAVWTEATAKQLDEAMEKLSNSLSNQAADYLDYLLEPERVTPNFTKLDKAYEVLNKGIAVVKTKTLEVKPTTFADRLSTHRIILNGESEATNEWTKVSAEYGGVTTQVDKTTEKDMVEFGLRKIRAIRKAATDNLFGAPTKPIKTISEITDETIGSIDKLQSNDMAPVMKLVYEVSKTDQVIAFVRGFIEEGDMFSKSGVSGAPATYRARMKQVEGSARMAVQLAAMFGKEAIIYNQTDTKWYKQEGDTGLFTEVASPVLRKNCLVTGTSTTSKETPAAVRALIENSIGKSSVEVEKFEQKVSAVGGVQVPNTNSPHYILDGYLADEVTGFSGTRNFLYFLLEGRGETLKSKNVVELLKEEFKQGSETITQKILTAPTHAKLLELMKAEHTDREIALSLEEYVRRVVTETKNLVESKVAVKKILVTVTKGQFYEYDIQELPFWHLDAKGKMKVSVQNSTIMDEMVPGLEFIIQAKDSIDVEYIEGFRDLSKATVEEGEDIRVDWTTFHRSSGSGKQFAISLAKKKTNRIYLNVFGEKDTLPILNIKTPEARRNLEKFMESMSAVLGYGKKRKFRDTLNIRLLVEMMKLGYTPLELKNHFEGKEIERREQLTKDANKATATLMKRAHVTSPKVKINQEKAHLDKIGISTDEQNSTGIFVRGGKVWARVAIIDEKSLGSNGNGLNSMGLPINDGAIIGFDNGFFSVWPQLTGSLNEGTVKTWGILRFPDGKVGYLKSATHEFLATDEIGQLAKKHKVGLFISTSAEKNFAGGDFVNSYADLTSDSIKTIEMPLEDFNRIKEGGKAKRETLGFGQFFGRKFLSAGNELINPDIMKIVNKVTARRTKEFNESLADNEMTEKIAKWIINNTDADAKVQISKEILSAAAQNYIDNGDQSFVELLKHPYLNSLVERFYGKYLEDFMKFKVKGASPVLTLDLGNMAQSRINRIKQSIFESLATTPLTELTKEEMSALKEAFKFNKDWMDAYNFL
jgi:hypothetical protein